MLNIKVKVPTWTELCVLEPALVELEKLARSLADESDDSDESEVLDPWYLQLKPRLVKLVGWERPVPGYTARELPLDKFGCISADQLLDPADTAKRKAAYEAVPEKFQVLYDSTAYNVAYEYLLGVLEGGE